MVQYSMEKRLTVVRHKRAHVAHSCGNAVGEVEAHHVRRANGVDFEGVNREKVSLT